MVADGLPGSCEKRVTLCLLSLDFVRCNGFISFWGDPSCAGTAE